VDTLNTTTETDTSEMSNAAPKPAKISRPFNLAGRYFKSRDGKYGRSSENYVLTTDGVVTHTSFSEDSDDWYGGYYATTDVNGKGTWYVENDTLLVLHINIKTTVNCSDTDGRTTTKKNSVLN